MKSSTPIILILISVGLFYTFINPQYVQVKKLQAEASQFSDMLGDVSQMAGIRDALLVQYRNIPKENIENLEKALPNHSDTVRLALDLDAIASKYGISIKKIEVGDKARNDVATVIDTTAVQATPSPLPTYQKETVTFSFTSNYEDFRLFVRDMEKSLRILDIQRVNFQVGENESGLYDYKLTVGTYWLQ
jgi:Tfp pilus assembly protein PilO